MCLNTKYEGYLYHELNSLQKSNALLGMYQILRDGLGFSIKKNQETEKLIESIIEKLEPKFDEYGIIILFSKKYEKLTIDMIEKIYTECQIEKMAS